MLTHIDIDQRLGRILEKAQEVRTKNQRNLEQGLGVEYAYFDFAELAELAGDICVRINDRKNDDDRSSSTSTR